MPISASSLISGALFPWEQSGSRKRKAPTLVEGESDRSLLPAHFGVQKRSQRWLHTTAAQDGASRIALPSDTVARCIGCLRPSAAHLAVFSLVCREWHHVCRTDVVWRHLLKDPLRRPCGATVAPPGTGEVMAVVKRLGVHCIGCTNASKQRLCCCPGTIPEAFDVHSEDLITACCAHLPQPLASPSSAATPGIEAILRITPTVHGVFGTVSVKGARARQVRVRSIESEPRAAPWHRLEVAGRDLQSRARQDLWEWFVGEIQEQQPKPNQKHPTKQLPARYRCVVCKNVNPEAAHPGGGFLYEFLVVVPCIPVSKLAVRQLKVKAQRTGGEFMQW